MKKPDSAVLSPADPAAGSRTPLLDRIDCPDDIKRLSKAELLRLCAETRRFLIDTLSQTGGHVASNLGVVELTVALHRCFDTERDRLVFDVGHQCYAHKLFTGRRKQFSTLRQAGGLSGFPKPSESVHDAFIAGHASNSISVALGLARVQQTLPPDRRNHVVALIGDGAMTGGLAYEALNDAGAAKVPLIVILNDNGMSINANVGAVSEHLERLRSRPAYYHFKKWYRSLFGKHPAQNPIYRFNHRVKTFFKRSIYPSSTLFEDMGFTYLGPVDGHDLPRLCNTLEWAKELQGPVLVHVRTVKGKGCAYAERNPGRYHGVGPFDPETGVVAPSGESFSSVFGRRLEDCAAQDPRVCAITAAMADGTGLGHFAGAYPDRFFDVGIAEGHGAAMAAGLARQGMLPVFAVYSSFLQRSYDMLIHDIALQGLHVVLGVDRAGLVGADGETHHGCFDALFLSEIPGFTVYCPASFAELRRMLSDALFRCTGPVAVRYPRGGEGDYRADAGENALTCLRQGGDAAILTYGILVNEALAAAETLAADGIEAAVYKLNRISPLDWEDLKPLSAVRRLVVTEDAMGAGCVGQRVTAILAEHGQELERLILRNLGKTFAPEGTVRQLWERFGLDRHGIAADVREVMAP